MSKFSTAGIILMLALAPAGWGQAGPPGLTEKTLFRSGEAGYGRFRIPAIVVSPQGTLLAFCEGRKKAGGLTGDIDLVLRRSRDNGQSWQPLQVVADAGSDTLGNPCPVVDRRTGTIWLPFTRSRGQDQEAQIVAGKGAPTTVWISKSNDDGATWSKPVEITPTTRRHNWTWYGTGPGVGLQLPSGRLLVPSYHAEAGVYRSHLIYSDDHGQTWQLGRDIGDHTSECQVVQRQDGSLLVNCRSLQGTKYRTVATSRDGGATWSKPTLDEGLSEPDCQGCLQALPATKPQGGVRWLFSNPPGPRRENVTLRLSHDEGQTWPVSKMLYQGPSAYTCLTVLSDGTIGCLYERGVKQPYEEIAWARFSLGWLTDPRGVPGQERQPRLVGHRGLLHQAPEDTLAAFAACIDLRIGFELDVRRTRDGHLVCLHDEDVKRTTNGQGQLVELTWAQLRKLDAGSWFDPAFAGEHVPTLEEVFALLRQRQASQVLVALDLKIDDETVEQDVVKLAKQYGLLEQIVCIGRAINNPSVRKKLRTADPKTPVAVLAQTAKDLEAALADRHADWVYVRFVPTAAEAALVHRAGKRVFLAGPTVMGREPANWGKAREAGVDAVLTDFPLECRLGWRQPRKP